MSASNGWMDGLGKGATFVVVVVVVVARPGLTGQSLSFLQGVTRAAKGRTHLVASSLVFGQTFQLSLTPSLASSSLKSAMVVVWVGGWVGVASAVLFGLVRWRLDLSRNFGFVKGLIYIGCNVSRSECKLHPHPPPLA